MKRYGLLLMLVAAFLVARGGHGRGKGHPHPTGLKVECWQHGVETYSGYDLSALDDARCR